MDNKVTRTKTKIIRVAKDLFDEISVLKATMTDIAVKANVSRRTLYSHFANKEDIYKYVVKMQCEDISNKLKKIANLSLAPDRKLRLYILARFNAIDKLVQTNKFIRHDFIFNNHRVEILRRDIDKNEIKLLKSILQEGVDKKIFNISNPNMFAITLLRMCKSLEQPFIMIGNRSSNYDSLIEYVNLLFNGIINSNKVVKSQKQDESVY